MIWQYIIAGLSLGLLAGFHCAGMCGPLMMALPVYHLERWQRIRAVSLYHAGRIFTYISLGALSGLAGRRTYMAGWQQYFSITCGIIMLLIALLNSPVRPRILQKFYALVQQMMAKAMRFKSPAGFLVLGACNGLLPCGMVYMAVAATLASTQWWQGPLFMSFYGIGTLPLLLMVSVLSFRISLSLRVRIKKLMPVAMIVIAVLFILRGMNLGIPFISPVLPSGAGAAIHCR